MQDFCLLSMVSEPPQAMDCDANVVAEQPVAGWVCELSLIEVDLVC